MSENKHEIDVHVIEGESGAVHVRTGKNLESALVDRQFEEIATSVGNLAIDITVPKVRETNADREQRELGKMARLSVGRPARVPKAKK